MKNLYTLALVLFCAFVGKAQIINIPDAAFKAKLLSADVTNQIASTNLDFYNIPINYVKIDSNNDGEIQLNEVLAIKYLDVSGTYSLNGTIGNMTGVDSFLNILVLKCDYNVITTLNVSGLNNLQKLFCNYNQINSLDVSGLINLQELVCGFNQLTSINVSGLTNLTHLDCSYNQIISLNVSGLSNIYMLDCSYNQLSSITLTGLQNLAYLFCGNNQLTTLDASELNHLVAFDSSYNQLITIFIKNGAYETFDGFENVSSFSNNPNLQYICADNSQITFIQNKIIQLGYTNCHVNSYCTFTPGGNFFTIQGANHYDENNNGCDATDIHFPNLKLAFTNGTATVNLIPDSTGNYHYDVQASTQTFSPILENINYFNVSPTSATVTFPTNASPFIQDFCVTANGSHPDLEVIIMPIGGARPGFDAKYKIVYRNKGTNTQSGIVNLTFNDAVLDLVSANSVVSTQTLNNLSWNFSNLHPFESREIVFTLNVNAPTETPAVNSGDVLNYVTTISSTATETTPADNTFAYNQTVVNAFDPNEKVCLEGNTIAPAKVGDFVHYIIRFENDGTANAQNIVVKDMIDTTKFDIATLIPESGSATYTTRITNTNQVEFVFQNINLPFTAGTNTGYVAFKIKTKPTLVLGNTFSNTASIYFDYNFPINTNTATTTVQALAIQDFEFNNYFTLYPNPAKNVLNISTKSTIEVHSLTIYNLLGQVVLAIPNAQNLNSVDVSSLKTGNYFLKITSDKGSATEKFMKE
jgi:Leucine-rich repeat (LRR) protein